MKKVIFLLALYLSSPAWAQTVPIMQVNEVGKVLKIYPNPGVTGPTSLTGATSAILRVQQPSPALTVQNFSLTISADGTYGTYRTQNGDFPTAGLEKFELVATYSGGVILRSPVQTQLIGAIIPGTP